MVAVSAPDLGTIYHKLSLVPENQLAYILTSDHSYCFLCSAPLLDKSRLCDTFLSKVKLGNRFKLLISIEELFEMLK